MLSIKDFYGNWKAWLVYSAVASLTDSDGFDKQFTINDLLDTGIPYNIIDEGIKEIMNGAIPSIDIVLNKNSCIIRKNTQLQMFTLSGDIKKTENKKIFRQFTDTWCEEFKKFWGYKYDFKTFIDGQAVKRLLKIDSIDNIIALARKAWQMSQENYFYCKKSVTINGFAANYNQIVAEIKNAEIRPVNPYLQLKIINELLSTHPCNPESVYFNSNYTDEQYQEFIKLKEKRSNIMKTIAKMQ